MGSHFWVTSGTGGEEHQHGIIAAGTFFSAFKGAAVHHVFVIKIMPAISGSVSHNFDFYIGATFHS